MDRPSRMWLAAVVLLFSVSVLGVQAATADEPSPQSVQNASSVSPGQTLVTVQSYRWFDRVNGQAFIVDRNGSVSWLYDPPNSRVFDAEQLQNGNLLISLGRAVESENCPHEYKLGTECIQNRVIELDPETNTEVWNYSWYDAFIEWHEVHDADRLPSGETLIVDMGNDRAFAVDRDGERTWNWSAEQYLGPGSEFWSRYIPPESADSYRKTSEESDWTHANDIDQLSNGNVQLSIRNFDVVIEVDPETNTIVDVIGRPGKHELMHEQHDPNRLEQSGTILIADSENDRVVEIDVATEDIIWSYSEGLAWPRDADRLPNGNTLIADSRNFRVVEVSPAGEVVWEYSLAESRGIVYDVDRLGLPEEPEDVPSGRNLSDSVTTDGTTNWLTTVESWAGFVFPPWVGVPELATLVVLALAAIGLAIDTVFLVATRRR